MGGTRGVSTLVAGLALAGLLVGTIRLFQGTGGSKAGDVPFQMLAAVHTMDRAPSRAAVSRLTMLFDPLTGVANSSAGSENSNFTAAPVPTVYCNDTFGGVAIISSLKAFNKIQVRCPAHCRDNVNASKILEGDLAYTAASSVCRAALYEGVIGDHGGKITVRALGTVKAFYGNARRGIGSNASATGANGFAVEADSCIGHRCHHNAVCAKVLGGYQCKCRPGYQGSGLDCVDLGNCKVGGSNCNEQSKCVDIGGTMKCQCPAGTAGLGLKGTRCKTVCHGHTAPYACGGISRGLCVAPNKCKCLGPWSGKQCKQRKYAATCEDLGIGEGKHTLYINGSRSHPFKAKCLTEGKNGTTAFVTDVGGFIMTDYGIPNASVGAPYIVVSNPSRNIAYSCAGAYSMAEETMLSWTGPWLISKDNALRVMGCKAAAAVTGPGLRTPIEHRVGCDPDKVVPVIRTVKHVLPKDMTSVTIKAGGACGKGLLFWPDGADEHAVKLRYAGPVSQSAGTNDWGTQLAYTAVVPKF